MLQEVFKKRLIYKRFHYKYGSSLLINKKNNAHRDDCNNRRKEMINNSEIKICGFIMLLLMVIN